MDKLIEFVYMTGKNLYITAKGAPVASTISLVETAGTGHYSVVIPTGTPWADGKFLITVYRRLAGTPNLLTDEILAGQDLYILNDAEVDPITRLMEIYTLYGLDPTKPLVVTPTSRAAGDIHQDISSDNSHTAVQRV